MPLLAEFPNAGRSGIRPSAQPSAPLKSLAVMPRDDVVRTEAVAERAQGLLVLFGRVADVAGVEHGDLRVEQPGEMLLEPDRGSLGIAHERALHHRVTQHQHAHRGVEVGLGTTTAPRS